MMATRRVFGLRLATCALTTAFVPIARSQRAPQGPIRIGQSTSLSGPLAKDGKAGLLGAQAYIKFINSNGGVDGAPIELISLDDGFDEARAAENTRRLVAKEKVVGLFQYTGTGPTLAAAKVLAESKVPLLGPITGAPVWRDAQESPDVYVIRAGYDRELSALVQQLSAMGISDVSLVLQDAAFTKSLTPVARAYFQREFKRDPVAEILIDRTEAKAAEAAKKLASTKCRAVVVISTSRPAALLVREIRKSAPGLLVMALSTVSPDQLSELLTPEEIRGVGIAQTIPNPNAVRVPVVQEYQSIFRKHTTEPFDYFSIEGFINAKVLVAALRRSGTAITPAKFRAGIESLRDFDVGGMRITFGPRNRTGSTFVDVTVIGQGGKLLK